MPRVQGIAIESDQEEKLNKRVRLTARLLMQWVYLVYKNYLFVISDLQNIFNLTKKFKTFFSNKILKQKMLLESF